MYVIFHFKYNTVVLIIPGIGLHINHELANSAVNPQNTN